MAVILMGETIKGSSGNNSDTPVGTEVMHIRPEELRKVQVV